jgi:hypothetical protein
VGTNPIDYAGFVVDTHGTAGMREMLAGHQPSHGRNSSRALAMLFHDEIATRVWPSARRRNHLEPHQFEKVTCEELKPIAIGSATGRLGDLAEVKHW